MASFVRNKRFLEIVTRVTQSRSYSVLFNCDKAARSHSISTATVSRRGCKMNKSFTKSLNIPCQEFHVSASRNKVVAFNLSDIGEGIREVAVKEWFVKEGDKVEQFDNICEVQSDKASVTITSRYDGVITKLYHKLNEIALVGQPLVDIEVVEEASETSSSETSKVVPELKEDSTSESSGVATTGKVLTTPSVRRIAMQYKLDLKTVKSTGKNGRILKDDILRHLNLTSDESNVVPQDVIIDEATESKTTSTIVVGVDKTVPVSGYSKIMIKTMTASLKIPHFVYSDEVDITKLVQLRTDLKEEAVKRGAKLTFMPFFIKAASLALRDFPIINSTYNEDAETITYKASHNIGVAMDTPSGLAVPNIKNVQSKSLLEIAIELNRLQQDGIKSNLKISDLTGTTFSLSNIGVVGGTYTKPVIVPPQVSIGALGKTQILPRFEVSFNADSSASVAVVRAHVLCVSWAADHRVIDGVTMAGFSNRWKSYLQRPENFLLDL